MVIIVYVALAFFLFWGVKFIKKKSWNEELMSFDHTKCFLGFCAVIVVLHHCSQWTCAPWLPQNFIRPGLDIFVTAGYPMVGMFFFFSGFGLYKSSKTKPDFFNNFKTGFLGILWRNKALERYKAAQHGILFHIEAINQRIVESIQLRHL